MDRPPRQNQRIILTVSRSSQFSPPLKSGRFLFPPFSSLHILISQYFGYSRPENGKIIYKAAAEEKEKNEAEKLKLKSMTIKKASFISILIKDYPNNVSKISDAFQILLKSPDIDPNGYCLEYYISKDDVRCMVPLK